MIQEAKPGRGKVSTTLNYYACRCGKTFTSHNGWTYHEKKTGHQLLKEAFNKDASGNPVPVTIGLHWSQTAAGRAHMAKIATSKNTASRSRVENNRDPQGGRFFCEDCNFAFDSSSTKHYHSIKKGHTVIDRAPKRQPKGDNADGQIRIAAIAGDRTREGAVSSPSQAAEGVNEEALIAYFFGRTTALLESYAKSTGLSEATLAARLGAMLQRTARR